MSKIKEALEKLFNDHRIIFWYNNHNEFEQVYNDLEFEQIKKIQLNNNEFKTKHQVLVSEPEQKFLIYSGTPKPEDDENWILDLNLAFYEFSADKASMFAQELLLPIEMKSFIEKYDTFFDKKDLRQKMSSRIESGDKESDIFIKMLLLLTKIKGNYPDLALLALFSEEANYISTLEQSKKDPTIKVDRDKIFQSFRDIQKYNMEKEFWELIAKKYGYKNDQPSIKNFIIELFNNKFQKGLRNGKPTLTSEASILVDHWMNSEKDQKSFEILVEEISTKLRIKNLVMQYDYKDLIECDVYKEVDQEIIFRLVKGLSDNSLNNEQIKEIINKRRHKYWYKFGENIYYGDLYETVYYASELNRLIKSMSFDIRSMKEGFNAYVKTFYEIDYIYRKCTLHYNRAQHSDLQMPLKEMIEGLYSNRYLLPLSENWQTYVSNCNNWQIEDVILQRHFFKNYVEKFLKKNNKIFVIICDALRYESGVELNKRLMEDGKYRTNLSSILSMLPSYTQLGIASLLPNTKLTFDKLLVGSNADVVSVDGQTSESSSREKIIQKYLSQQNYNPAKPTRATYITSKDLLEKKAEEARKFVSDYDVIYIYENKIDATGDHSKLQDDVFEATEKLFTTVSNLVNKIFVSKGTNILITADHGYIYQNHDLEDNEYIKKKVVGDIRKSNRRFIIGKNLIENETVKHFMASQVNVDDDTEFIIPKTIRRFSIQGSGDRFVHGGSSLQEIVVPVIEVNRNEDKDINYVEVDIVEKVDKLTSNQVSIKFLQSEPISDKVMPVEVKAAFYSEDGKLLSKEFRMTFKFTGTDSRSREWVQTFELQNTKDYLNSRIILKIDNLIENYSIKTMEYPFQVSIAFPSDFD